MEINKTKVLPIIVTDTKELDLAVTNKEKVIIVTNKDLFSAIKKNVTKDSIFHKKSRKMLKMSGLAVVGGLVGACIAPPLIIPGLITAGVILLLGVWQK